MAGQKPSPEERRASAAHLATVLLADRAESGAGLDAHYRELLSILVWKWTEAEGKYRGCRFWTPAALAAGRSEWAHEHVVPRRLVVGALLELPVPTAATVRSLLEDVALACVVTRAEHDALPEVDWDELLADPWVRLQESRDRSHGARSNVVSALGPVRAAARRIRRWVPESATAEEARPPMCLPWQCGRQTSKAPANPKLSIPRSWKR